MSYPNEASDKVIRATSLKSAIDDLDPVIARVEQLVARAAKCADQIMGPRPSEAKTNGTAPSPNHLIYSIQHRRERLVRALDYLEPEIGRIEQGLDCGQ